MNKSLLQSAWRIYQEEGAFLLATKTGQRVSRLVRKLPRRYYAKTHRKLTFSRGKTRNVGDGTEVLLSSDGTWTMSGTPYGICSNGISYIGCIESRGNPKIIYYDHNSGEIGETILEENFAVDDHASATLLVRDDGHIMAFWDRRNVSNEIRFAISENPNDASVFSEADGIKITDKGPDYASPVQLPNGDIYLFFRGPYIHSHSWVRSKDRGKSWGDQTMFIQAGSDEERRVYTQNYHDEENNSIHFVAANHPRPDGDKFPHDPPYNIWYVRWDYNTGTWYLADGTEIGSDGDLPLNMLEDLDVVYDWETNDSIHAWDWDITAVNGQPRILFATFPDVDDHRYHHAQWTGSEWDVNEVIKAGGPLIGPGEGEDEYSGGCRFDHRNPNRVYASIEEEGKHKIKLVESTDDGNSWNTIADLAKGARPEFIRGEEGGPEIIYWRGMYNFYTDYYTEVCAWTNNNQLEL